MSAPTPVEVRVPGDKSITHRALILASLATGPSRLRGLLDAADTRSTAAALRSLGVGIADGPLADLRIAGAGVHGWAEPPGTLDCGNSGTTARLLLGALAGCPFEAELTGDASLRTRPMRRVTEPLTAAGAGFRGDHGAGRLPLRVRGARPLHAIDWHSPRASAQVKTALLLAGITGGADVSVEEPVLSRDHTERMLRAMGVDVESGAGAGGGEGRRGGARVHMAAPASLAPLDLHVPGDISSAMYFVALAALAGAVRVRDVGLNPTRTGALDVMRRMGAAVRWDVTDHGAGEPVGDVEATAGPLRGVRVAPDEVPSLLDEVPLLAMLASRADGETRFDGVAELRVKESDRVRAVTENLRRIGVEAEEGPDHLAVLGTDQPLSGKVESYGDHRIAMAFGVLAASPGARIEIDDAAAVGISYPGFWTELQRTQREMEQA